MLSANGMVVSVIVTATWVGTGSIYQLFSVRSLKFGLANLFGAFFHVYTEKFIQSFLNFMNQLYLVPKRVLNNKVRMSLRDLTRFKKKAN